MEHIAVYSFEDFNTTDIKYRQHVIIISPYNDHSLLIEYCHIPTFQKNKIVLDYTGNILVGNNCKEQYLHLIREQIKFDSVKQKIEKYVSLIV